MADQGHGRARFWSVEDFLPIYHYLRSEDATLAVGSSLQSVTKLGSMFEEDGCTTNKTFFRLVTV